MGSIERVDELFHAAMELPEGERAAFLGRACGEDDSLRSLVTAMVEFEEREPRFLRGRAADDAVGLSGRKLPPTLGGFRILGKLGEGGMGTVYEAEQSRPRRIVALKVLRPEFLSEASRRRFEREAELLGRLGHPGIAQVHESGVDETHAGGAFSWFAMELVRGVPITQFARERELDVRGRIELFSRACRAVHHAHLEGIVHRDLKPSNVLVDGDGNPKVLDFGIARLTERVDERASIRTTQGQILGTLAYMSPEQASGNSRAVDARSDVYSLGVVLYELLTGELPCDVTSMSLPEAVRVIRDVDPSPASHHVPALRGDLEVILSKALEKDPGRRYASTAELVEDLRRHLAGEPVTARPASKVYRVRKFVGRNRLLVAATVAVVLAMGTGSIASLHFGLAEAEARKETEGAMHSLRASSYRSGLLAAAGLLKAGNFHDARELLEGLPAELRGWGWGALHRRAAPVVRTFDLPGLVMASCDPHGGVLALDERGGLHRFSLDGEARAGGRSGGGQAYPLAIASGGARAAFLEGETVVVRSPDGEDAGTGLSLPDLELGQRPVRAALSPTGRYLALATDEGEVLLARLGPAPVVQRLDCKGSRGLVFSPDGERLAAMGVRDLSLWQAEGGKCIWRTPLQKALLGLAFDPRGDRIACGWQDRILLLALETGELERKWSAELGDEVRRRVLDVAFSPRGDLVAVRLQAADAVVLRSDSGELVTRLPLPPGSVNSAIAFGPEGRTLLASEPDRDTLQLFAVDRGASELLATVPGSNEFRALAWSPTAAILAAGGTDGRTRVIDVEGGREVAVFEHGGVAHSESFSPDGRRLAVGLLNRGFFIGDIRAPSTSLKVQMSAMSVAWSPRGNRLAIGSDRGFVTLVDGERFEAQRVIHFDDERVNAFERRVNALAWAPDGSLLAAGTRGGRLGLIDPRAGTVIASAELGSSGFWEREGVQELAFSPDGTVLASALGSSALRLWSVPELEHLRDFQGHQGGVHTLSWSPDGRRLASGGRDRLLRLWDVESGLLFSLPGHQAGICDLAFDSRGRYLATASRDGTLRLWDSIPWADQSGLDEREEEGRPPGWIRSEDVRQSTGAMERQAEQAQAGSGISATRE